jgi:hypothetical protein
MKESNEGLNWKKINQENNKNKKNSNQKNKDWIGYKN